MATTGKKRGRAAHPFTAAAREILGTRDEWVNSGAPEDAESLGVQYDKELNDLVHEFRKDHARGLFTMSSRSRAKGTKSRPTFDEYFRRKMEGRDAVVGGIDRYRRENQLVPWVKDGPGMSPITDAVVNTESRIKNGRYIDAFNGVLAGLTEIGQGRHVSPNGKVTWGSRPIDSKSAARGERMATVGYLAEKTGKSVNQVLKEHATKGKDLTVAAKRRASLAERQRTEAKAARAAERKSQDDARMALRAEQEANARQHVFANELADEALYRTGGSVELTAKALVESGVTPDAAAEALGRAVLQYDPRQYNREIAAYVHAAYIHNSKSRLSTNLRSALAFRGGGSISDAAEQSDHIVVGSRLLKRYLKTADSVPESFIRSSVSNPSPSSTTAVKALLDNKNTTRRVADAVADSEVVLNSPFLAKELIKRFPDNPGVKRGILGSDNPEVIAKAALLPSVTAGELVTMAASDKKLSDAIMNEASWATVTGKGTDGSHGFISSVLSGPSGGGVASSKIGDLLLTGRHTPSDIRARVLGAAEHHDVAMKYLMGTRPSELSSPGTVVDVLRRAEDSLYSAAPDFRSLVDGQSDPRFRRLANIIDLLNVREAWADKVLANSKRKPSPGAAANLEMMDALSSAGLDLAGVNRRFRSFLTGGDYGPGLVLQRANSLGGAMNDLRLYGGLNNFSMFVVPGGYLTRSLGGGFAGAPPIGPSGNSAPGYKVIYQMRPDAFPSGPRTLSYHRDAGTGLSGDAHRAELSGRLASRSGYNFVHNLAEASGWNFARKENFSRRISRGDFWGVNWTPGHSDIAAYPMSVLRRYYTDTLYPSLERAPGTHHNWDFGEVKHDGHVNRDALNTKIGKVLIVEGSRASRTDEVDDAIRSYREELSNLDIPSEEVVSDRRRQLRGSDGRRTESEAQKSSEFGFDLKGGRAIRAALEGGESAGEPSAAPQAPEAPAAPAESYSGPRIAVNPEVFSDDRDALCVALNEAFRVIMEINGFDPVAEPTDAQRRFFADTAYANDETQLRRTILARICTFDTSIGKPAGGEHTGHRESTAPTQEQLEEAVEFLHTVLEIGAPQNKWEQNVVKRILTVLEKAVEAGRSSPAEEVPTEKKAPAEKKAPVSSPEEVQGDFYGGAVSKEEEDEFKRLDAEADRQIAEEKEVKQFLEERGMEYGPGTTTMEDAIAKHTEMVSGNAPADNPAVAGFGSAEDVAKQRSEMEKWAADRDTNLEKKAESELGAKVFAGTATDEEKAQWNNVAQQAAAQPFGGGGDAVVQQDSSRFVTNKAGMMVLNRDGSGAASRQAADFRGSTFDRATGNWSFADGTRMTSADKKAMNDIFNRGGRFDSTSIRKGMDDFDWS